LEGYESIRALTTSERASIPIFHDAQQSARDLHTALQQASISGPYVLAGHSYGELVIRAFADLYPDEAETLTQLQAALPALSSNSMHLTVQGATHENLIARRENAVIVVDAIRRVIESTQTGELLGQGN
jgi:pimeloyl-ACP methyl ester carboxylesterase